MQNLVPEKLVTIITSDVLENRLIAVSRKHGVSGYTIVRARGAGTSGEQSGMLDVDTNIKFHIIVSPERIAGVLDDLERMMRERYHLTVFVLDVGVLNPENLHHPF